MIILVKKIEESFTKLSDFGNRIKLFCPFEHSCATVIGEILDLLFCQAGPHRAAIIVRCIHLLALGYCPSVPPDCLQVVGDFVYAVDPICFRLMKSRSKTVASRYRHLWQLSDFSRTLGSMCFHIAARLAYHHGTALRRGTITPTRDAIAETSQCKMSTRSC